MSERPTLPLSPLDAVTHFVKSFEAARAPKEGPTYRVTFDGRTVSHALRPKHRAIGYIIADMSWGGGLRILCGLPTEGKVVISERLVPIQEITCRNCLRVLAAAA